MNLIDYEEELHILSDELRLVQEDRDNINKIIINLDNRAKSLQNQINHFTSLHQLKQEELTTIIS